jgi:hypothetical protein
MCYRGLQNIVTDKTYSQHGYARAGLDSNFGCLHRYTFLRVDKYLIPILLKLSNQGKIKDYKYLKQ